MGYDVIVIGLGGMGSAAAYHLARRGQRVLELERYDDLATDGATGHPISLFDPKRLVTS